MQPQVQKSIQKTLKLLSTNQFQKAWQECKKNLKKQGEVDSEIMHLAGVALCKLGRYSESIVYLKKTLATDPKRSDYQNSLAQCYKFTDEHKALIHQRNAVSLKAIPEHLANLATLEVRLGYYKEAVVHAKRAVAQRPQYIEAWVILCRALVSSFQFKEALEFASNLPEKVPETLQILIESYLGLNNYDKGVAAIKAMIKLKGLTDEHIIFCYESFRKLGEEDLANDLLSSNWPKSLEWQILAKLLQNSMSIDELKEIENQYQELEVNVLLKRRLAFFIARNFKRLDKEKWIEWLDKANAITPNGFEYQEKNTIELLKQAAANFSSINLPGSSLKSDTPIFVVGMPRSGTTLVETILGGHSKIFACGEVNYLSQLLNATGPDLAGHEQMLHCLSGLDKLTTEDLNNIGQHYLKKLRKFNTSADYLVDKLPHNFLFVSIIAKIFPNAKIIHVQRNPIANILSIYEQNFSQFHSYGGNIVNLINYYKTYQEFMNQMQTILPTGFVHSVSYEDLVNNTKEISEQFFNYCGLLFEEQCLELDEIKRSVMTASVSQVRNKVYKSSLRPWEGLESRLEGLLGAFPEHR